MKTHALESTEVNKVVDISEEAVLVALQGFAATAAPELVGYDPGQDSLAKGRDAREWCGQLHDGLVLRFVRGWQ